MAFRLGKAGPLVIAGIAIYVAVHVAQGRAAESLCDRYTVGARIENVENLEGTFLLTPMGHFDPDIETSQTIIFCAATTMCDKSCRLEIENGRVTESQYSSL